MIGPKATIPDGNIELMLHDLTSDIESTSDFAKQHHQYRPPVPANPPKDTYRVETVCGPCHTPLKLVVACSANDIQGLNKLLIGTLDLICPRCAGRLGYNGPRQ